MQFKSWFFNEEKVMMAIPYKHQTENYDCGPAALFSILSFFNVGPKDYSQLIQDCKTTKRNGTDPDNIVKVAKSYGLRTKEYHNMTLKKLEELLDKEKPVIIDIQAWGNENKYKNLTSGHYAIAVGYDDKKIYFQDPLYYRKSRRSMDKEEFLKLWKDKKSDGSILNHYAIAFWKN